MSKRIQHNQNDTGRFNVVFQKKFSNTFSARLVAADQLNSLKYAGTFNNFPLTNARYKNLYHERGFSISVTYRFGKAIKDLRQHRSDASSDEQDRVKN